MRHIEIPTDGKLAGADPGSAPMLQWLKISDLVIDDTYQRDLKKDNWTSIRKIADRFKWSLFSPVFVAPVEGGKFAVIDGQHRAHAAALVGLDSVPCQIVHMTPAEQAASFAAVNGMVTKVTGFQILKAAFAAGEKWAVEAAQVCSDAGCRLMMSNSTGDQKKPGEIYPIALIRKGVIDGRGAMMTKVLAALRASKFGGTADAYVNDILKPLFSAVNDKPTALRATFDLPAFMDAFDFHGALDRAADFVKTKRRQGVSGISGFDIVAGEIREAIDRVAIGRSAARPPEAKPAAGAPGLIGVPVRAAAQVMVDPVARPARAPSPTPAPPAKASAPELTPSSRVNIQHRDGRYLNRFGTGFTDRPDVAWEGTKERADALIVTKVMLRECHPEPVE